MLFFFFLVTPCLVVAVQPCMGWIPIKKKKKKKNYYQNVRIWYDISLTIEQIVINITYEYMMTSSDQILWIFWRVSGPIYSVKLILLKLKVQHIYYFSNYFVNSPAHFEKTSLIRLVLFHPLNTFLPDVKSLQTHCY